MVNENTIEVICLTTRRSPDIMKPGFWTCSRSSIRAGNSRRADKSVTLLAQIDEETCSLLSSAMFQSQSWFLDWRIHLAKVLLLSAMKRMFTSTERWRVLAFNRGVTSRRNDEEKPLSPQELRKGQFGYWRFWYFLPEAKGSHAVEKQTLSQGSSGDLCRFTPTSCLRTCLGFTLIPVLLLHFLPVCRMSSCRQTRIHRRSSDV